MPVHLRMSDDQKYLIYEITDPLSMNDLLEAYKQEKTYRDATPYTLHSIVDMSQVRRIPPNWLVAKAGPGLTHPRSGEILFVGISYGLKIIVETILKITKYRRIKFFVTRAEADTYMKALVMRTPTEAKTG